MTSSSESAAPSLEDRLRGLAAFAPIFESEGYEFGHWRPQQTRDDGAIVLPYFVQGRDADDFVHACYALGWIMPGFDWGAWKGTAEARALVASPAALAKATTEELSRMLTTLIRQDRFVEGSLARAFQRGLLTAIARRAAVLVSETPGLDGE